LFADLFRLIHKGCPRKNANDAGKSLKLLPEENISRLTVGYGADQAASIATVTTAGHALIFSRPMRRLARFLQRRK
jgi:hypothetical protein